VITFALTPGDPTNYQLVAACDSGATTTLKDYAVAPDAIRSPDGLSRMPTIEHMTIQRMDHVGIVVDDLADAVAFFVELGLELQGDPPVEGDWVDRVVGLEGVRAQIAMLRTPNGH
jgi:hypothetical protein